MAFYQRIELEGVAAGSVRNVEGGMPRGEVVLEKVGVDGWQRKHLGSVVYDDIHFEVGTGLSSDFYRWIEALSRADEAGAVKHGALLAAGEKSGGSRLEFTGGRVVALTLPGLDAQTQEAAWLAVRVRPELTRLKVPAESKPGPTEVASIHGFRLRIDGLEKACARASRVEALPISRGASQAAPGPLRDDAAVDATLVISDLVVTFPDADVGPVLAWFEDFVVQGNCGQGQEKAGTLEYLGADAKQVLFTAELRQLGIHRLTPVRGDGGELRWQAALYVEELRLKASAAASG